MALEPMLPRYGDRSLAELIGVVRGSSTSPGTKDLRDAISGASSTILLIADGFGACQLDEFADLAPRLHSAQLEPATSVAPSTTAAALTSLTTGRTPGEHGIVGYRMRVGDAILQSLRWSIDGVDAQQRCRPDVVQPCEPLLRIDGQAVAYVGKAQYEHGGFTRAHLRGADYIGIDDSTSLVASLALAAQHASMVVGYHDAIDHVAHAEGLGEGYRAEVVRLEAIVNALRASLSDDVAIVVVADHGQIDVGSAEIVLPRAALALTSFMSGEGRFRWLHAVLGEQRSLALLLKEALSDTCWVWTRREAIDLGLFGPEVTLDAEERFGDVCVVPFVDAFVLDPAEAKEARMRGRHGSLTPEEMLIPVIVR